MFLIRLIYASKISAAFDPADIPQIVESSKGNNEAMNITGVLCYNNDYFLQCLEGSRVAVNQLYHHILKDDRHYDPAILQYKEIQMRDFMQWNMGYLPPSIVSGDMVLKFSGERTFNPFSMSGERCHLLLKSLTDNNLTMA